MKFCLLVSKGKHKGMPIPVDIDLFMIGSSKECQLRTKVPGIGDQQCALVTRGKKVFIRDFGGEHSTLVNGEAIPEGNEWPLHAGDSIELGPLGFQIQFRETPLSQRDLEEWALRCLDTGNEQARSAIEAIDDVAVAKKQANNASAAAAAMLDGMALRRGLVKGLLRIGREGDITFVRVNVTDLVETSELASIKKELHDNLNAPNLRVLLDLKNVRRMSSRGAEMISELASWLRGNGCTVALCRLRPDLRDTLMSLGSMRSIPSFPDKVPAMEAVW